MIDGANTMVVSFAVFIMMLIVATIVFKTIVFFAKKIMGASTITGKYIPLNYFKKVRDSKVREYIPNFNRNLFLQERYLDWIKIKNALYDYKFIELKKLLTDELYDRVEERLIELKDEKKDYEVNIYTYYASMITDIYSENNKLYVKIELIYELNYKSLKIGSTGKEVDHKFLTYVCDQNLESTNQQWLLCKVELLK